MKELEELVAKWRSEAENCYAYAKNVTKNTKMRLESKSTGETLEEVADELEQAMLNLLKE